MINELKNKTRQVKETRLLKQDEVYNGALEDILLGKLIYCITCFKHSIIYLFLLICFY